MVGPLKGGSRKKKYLLVMVDKFTKWIEATGSDQHPPCGGARAPLAASANPEATDTMQKALEHGSVVEEHRTLMGAAMEKVQSTKSRLTEAFNSLLAGFEVSSIIFFISILCMCM